MGVKRPYDGSRRQAATLATKREVVETARRLFVDRGYPATTMAEISDASGIPQATVYRLFGSKRGVLKSTLDLTLGGDDQPVEYQHRPEVGSALSQEDPGATLDAFAHLVRELMHRSGALQHVLATSALVDADAAEMLEITRRQRHTGQSRIVSALARREALRPGLTERKAADVVYTVMSPEVFRILSVERGWSEDDYEAWLAQTLRTQLLSRSQP